MKWPAPSLPYTCTLCPVLYCLSSFSSLLTKHRWAGVATVCWAPGTCVPEWGSVICRCHISCDAHPIKGGWTASPINRSPFQTPPLFPDPRQLAAISCQDRTQQSSSPVSPLRCRTQAVNSICNRCCGISTSKPTWKLFKPGSKQGKIYTCLANPNYAFWLTNFCLYNILYISYTNDILYIYMYIHVYIAKYFIY